MLYGHRRDVDGYARALTEFDAWLPGFVKKLGPEDLLLITADHGCDPAYAATTDHTREYVPLVVLGPKVKPRNLGTDQLRGHRRHCGGAAAGRAGYAREKALPGRLFRSLGKFGGRRRACRTGGERVPRERRICL